MTLAGPIHFPPFRLDVAERRLYRGSTPIALRPKTFAVLDSLLQRPGRLVTKEHLLRTVWPDTAVGDAVLKVSVRELREALGDDPRSPRFIETAHRAGYRFVGEVARSNLPAPLTSFVGREREMEEIGRALERTRMMTLTGAGGSGKTRLAAELAAAMTTFPDGAWWVDLATLSDAALVPQTVVAALGLQERPGRSHVDTLAEHLQSRCLLLVLDNCEHLLRACAEIAARLLRACPELKVLATSREPLGLAGETVWPVPPLSLPDAEAVAALDEVIGCGAVRLFVDRARSALPRFDVEAGSVGALARICRRLDGLPLAIELAAPRVKMLSLEELAARLDTGFHSLLAAGPGGLARHQTLQATIDWSHELLAEKERLLLARLSVFAGGWTTAAAESVCSGAGIEETEVFELLSRLLDKSLVVAEQEAGRTRYRLLETVRQYGQEKLARCGESARLQRRHAEFHQCLAERLAERINTAERSAVVAQLGHEHDNFRAALRLAAETGDTALELRLCHALFYFWFYRGCWSEARAWLQGALARSAGEGGTKARARVMADEGTLACFMGDPLCLGRLEESAGIHRELGDPADLAYALCFLVTASVAIDPARARRLAEESTALSRAAGREFEAAVGLSQIGTAAYVQGDYAAARVSYEESAALCRARGDLWTLVLPLTKLGLVAFRLGDLDTAAAHLRESVAVQRDSGEQWFLSLGVEGLARVLAAQGHKERAARLLGAGESLREHVGAAILPFYLYDQDAAVAALRDALGEGRLASLWAEGRAMTVPQTISYALAETGGPAED